MAKVKMTLAEALKNHAVVVRCYFKDGSSTTDLSYFNLFGDDAYKVIGKPAETICEVELIDAASIQNEINKLQNLLESLNALKALHEVADNG